MVNKEGVQRVIAGDEHSEGGRPCATRATELLPQARAGPGPAADENDIEAADVDTHLQRIGRGERPDRAVAQVLLQRPALLGQISAPIGGDSVREIGIDRVE